jgi:hypothetical protein
MTLGGREFSHAFTFFLMEKEMFLNEEHFCSSA